MAHYVQQLRVDSAWERAAQREGKTVGHMRGACCCLIQKVWLYANRRQNRRCVSTPLLPHLRRHLHHSHSPRHHRHGPPAISPHHQQACMYTAARTYAVYQSHSMLPAHHRSMWTSHHACNAKQPVTFNLSHVRCLLADSTHAHAEPKMSLKTPIKAALAW